MAERKKRERGVRGNGATPVQRADGRWVTRLDLGVVNGKRERKYFYGKTAKEAQAQLNAALTDQRRGLPVANERKTVGVYLTDEWLPAIKPRVRASTYRSYEQNVRLYLVPALGHHRLATLQPEHVEQLMAARTADGLKPLSVRRFLVILRLALKAAEARGLVARNVAKLVAPPRVEHRELTILQGEALGLRWSDVDFNTRTLIIREAMQRVGKVGDGGGLRRVETKSASSRRSLALPAVIVMALKAHRARQDDERGAGRWEEHDLVFCTRYGTPLDGPNVTRYFQKLLSGAGLPAMRYHDLRHSAASFLAAQGVPITVAKDILGHSDIRLTANIYTHVLDAAKRDAADAMDRLFPQHQERPLPALVVVG